MPSPPFHKLEAIQKQVVSILQQEWAPGESVADDEYQYYAAELTKMRLADVDIRAMQLYLEWAEEQMDLLFFDTQRAIRVIEAIRAIRI